MRTGREVLLLAALWASGCGPGGTPRGTLAATWTGADTGSISGPATAVWCSRSRWIEITLVQADTGIGIALFPEALLTDGAYPIRPAGPDSVRRPRSAVAARWYTEQAIAGFRGESGSVSAELAGQRVTGRVEALLRAYDRGDTLRFAATFVGVPIRRDQPRCPPAAAGDSV